MPGIGGVLALAVLGIRYWWITLGAFVLICMIAGTQRDERVTKASKAREAFENESIHRRDARLTILYQIGKPICNGDYSATDKELWKIYHAKESDDEAWWNKAVHILIRLEEDF